MNTKNPSLGKVTESNTRRPALKGKKKKRRKEGENSQEYQRYEVVREKSANSVTRIRS